MEYRQIGNTGMKASVIGLGAEHLDGAPYKAVAEVIDAALDKGVNIIDVFMPGQAVRENIAKALGHRRKQVLLQGHIGSVDLRQQYDISRDVDLCRKYFENLLKAFHSDYMDFGMMFFIDSEEDFDKCFHSPYFNYVMKLKREGVIRAVGASSHNPRIAARIVETGAIELLLFSINPAFDMTAASRNVLESLKGAFNLSDEGIDPERYHLYKLCQSKGVGITVMKSLGSGKLLSPEFTPFARPLTVAQCIHYALTRPAVASVLVGCRDRAQVEKATAYLTATQQERDYSQALSSLPGNFRGKCVYCNHCLPCPAGIDIATLTKYLDIALLNPSEVPPSIRHHYQAMAHTASACVACGSCEARCPFGVPVVQNMKRAAEIFRQ